MTKLAMSGAKKICGQGDCLYAYHCGHTNKIPHPIPFCLGLDEQAECPLEKYHVEPDTRPFLERIDESFLKISEFRALCKECQYGVAGYIGNENDVEHCINCPVYGTYENMLEMEAEAAMC